MDVFLIVIYLLQGQEYAEAYRLEYKRRENDDDWIRYRDKKGDEVSYTYVFNLVGQDG